MIMRKGKYVLLLLQLCFILGLFGQQKGVIAHSTTNKVLSTKNTYAVVVGISDYQDKGIPDLHYADKDAEAFANFLRSSVFVNGDGLDPDHLRLLINQQATAGQVAAALDWLLEQAKEGDQIIIYFSGHGDVERKTVSQPGFLLCWDAPAKVYMGGGTYSLAYLQEIVSTLSTSNLAKVIVISDACHAGKLAGNQIGGSQLTTANLAKQFSNEIKILSCQPGEFSLEGEQWGGGRGVFSYHLVEGLYGLADRNADGIVSVGEIDRYLEDHVTSEAAPQTQVPMVLGNKTEQLATVNESLLKELKKIKASGQVIFAATEGRGFEDVELAKLDSNSVMKYYAFKKALVEKRFFKPENDCVEYYYASLSNESELTQLLGFMKRNYAAALQDDAQQAINRYMKADVHELSLSQKNKINNYSDFPRQLTRAANLLGQNHYLYRTLRARSAYFEGFPLIYGGEFTQEMIKRAAVKFQESISWDPDMPLALFGMQWIHGFGWAQADSAEYYFQKAIINSPTWILPCVRQSQIYSTMLSDFVNSKKYLDLAAQIDSTSPLYWEAEGSYYFEQMRYSEAEVIFKKIIENASSSTCLPCSQNLLVKIYLKTGRLTEAFDLVQKLINSDSTNATSHSTMGIVLTKLGRFVEAEKEFRISGRLSANNTNQEIFINYWQAYIYLEQDQIENAFEAFEKAIKLGYDDYSWMQVDPEFVALRQHSLEWDALMKKYFPEKVERK